MHTPELVNLINNQKFQRDDDTSAKGAAHSITFSQNKDDNKQLTMPNDIFIITVKIGDLEDYHF